MASIESKDQRNLHEVYSQIEKSLSRDWSDWAITNKDIDDVHKSLESLNRQDYHQCLERMGKNDLLNKYIDNMSSEARAKFLNQAAEKNYVQSERGSKPEGYKFNPPATPDVFLNDAKFPKDVRKAIHDYNIEKSNEYTQNYNAYIDRYIDSVKNAPSVEAIRDLGSPHPPQNVDADRGVTVSHPDYKRFLRDRIDRERQPRDFYAYRAVGDRVNDLTGVRRPGSFWLRAEGKIEAKADNLSFSAGGEAKISDYGSIDVKGKLGSETKAGPVKVGTEKTTDTDKTKLSVSVETKDGKGVKVKTDGEFEASSKLTYGKVNPEKATFEGGVKLDKKMYIGDYGIALKGKIGLGMKTITSKEVYRALTGPGFFHTESKKYGEGGIIPSNTTSKEPRMSENLSAQGERSSKSDTTAKETRRDVEPKDTKEGQEQTKQTPAETKSSSEKSPSSDSRARSEKQSEISTSVESKKGSVETAERFERITKDVPKGQTSIRHFKGEEDIYEVSKHQEGKTSVENVQTGNVDWKFDYEDHVIEADPKTTPEKKKNDVSKINRDVDTKPTVLQNQQDKSGDEVASERDTKDSGKNATTEENKQNDSGKSEDSQVDTTQREIQSQGLESNQEAETTEQENSSLSQDFTSDDLNELKDSVNTAQEENDVESGDQGQNTDKKSMGDDQSSAGYDGGGDQGQTDGDTGGGESDNESGDQGQTSESNTSEVATGGGF